MKIIEIAPLDNGAHRNQSYHGLIPNGWALIPTDFETENFPFGEVDVEEVDGVMTVTKWTPGEMPEPEPVPTPKPEDDPSVWDELDAAYQEGVNSAYDQ